MKRFSSVFFIGCFLVGSALAGDNVVINQTGKNTVTVNGKTYETNGGSISVRNGIVYVDGKPAEGKEPLKGSGKLATESRKLSNFHAVEVAGSFDVTIKPGKTLRCTVTADDNLHSFIQTKVEKKRLFIGTSGSFSTKNKMKVKLEMPTTLTALTSRASGKVHLENVTKDQVTISVSSSGSVTALGKAGVLHAEVRSSGSLDARYLDVEKAKVNVRSSGKAMIHAKQLDAAARSSGSIFHDTEPTQVSSSVRSSGKIIQKKWPAKKKH